MIMKIMFCVILWNLIISLLNKNKSNVLLCGIVGFSGYKDMNFDLNKLKILMIHNSFERGKDSTGVFTPKTGVIKSIDQATKFFADKDLNIIPDNIFIGHVRAATVGGKLSKNAHPFQYGNLVMCHNGTLTNVSSLCNKGGIKWADYDVDSQVIAARLNLERDATVLTQLEGSAAVIFHLNENNDIGNYKETLFAFRNADRPLFRGVTKEGLYISSIPESLEIIGCTNIKEFKENYLYSIENGIVKSPYKLTMQKPEETTYTAKDKQDFIVGSLYNEIINKWVKCNFGIAGKGYTLKYHEWYYITGFHSKTEVYFTKFPGDDQLIFGPVNAANFNGESYDYKPNDYLYMLTSLNWKNGGSKICDSGDLVKIVKGWRDVVDCVVFDASIKDKTKVFGVKYAYARKATDVEVHNFLTVRGLNNIKNKIEEEKPTVKEEQEEIPDGSQYSDVDEDIIMLLTALKQKANNILFALHQEVVSDAKNQTIEIINEIEESLATLQ